MSHALAVRGVCLSWVLLFAATLSACPQAGLQLQVLGSGGPELADGRASSSYLVWLHGTARVLVDAGAGAALRFGESGADFSDLDAIALTHLHVDHSADLPALVKRAYFYGRERDLPVFGPPEGRVTPDLDGFLNALFDRQEETGGGAFFYLRDNLIAPDKGARWVMQPRVVAELTGVVSLLHLTDLRLSAAAVNHGIIPALAYRVDWLVDGQPAASVVISGDLSGRSGQLVALASEVDLLVAHHAIPQDFGGVARRLHMPPSAIGQQAALADARALLLSHRMRRTIGREAKSEAEIRKHFAGPLAFAEDLTCYPVASEGLAGSDT